MKGVNNMDKLKVAVIFGGCSEEHDVSIKSAKEVAANINLEKYAPVYIGITKDGMWKMCDAPSVNWEENSCSAFLSPDREMHGLLVRKEDGYELLKIDVCFSVLHGKSGEDGAVQGLFEFSGIPYVGCDIQSSVLCMDKSLAYIMVERAGVKTPNFQVLHGEIGLYEDAIVYPVFVKPARSGSSFGVSKVHKKEELLPAIALAKQYDDKVLVEEAITSIEVGCAVMGNGNNLTVGEVDQITLTHGFFRIHQEENPEEGSENAKFIVPAELPAPKRAEIQEVAKTIYKALGCKGLARVDMFLQENGDVMLNEVNTLPGFTSYSRYPRMMQAAGIELPQLIDSLIDLALEDL